MQYISTHSQKNFRFVCVYICLHVCVCVCVCVIVSVCVHHNMVFI